MRRIETMDYIYEKVPIIVTPVNGSCFTLHCIQNVSFSEKGKLEFCTEKQVLIRCDEIEIDFKFGTFSHHFLHDRNSPMSSRWREKRLGQALLN